MKLYHLPGRENVRLRSDQYLYLGRSTAGIGLFYGNMDILRELVPRLFPEFGPGFAPGT